MKESEYTKRVCKALQDCNAVVIPYVASMRNYAHIPDRLVWHRYWHGFLEFKGVVTPISTGQRLTIKELNKRVPGSAFVVRCSGLGGVRGYIQDEDGTTFAEFATAIQLLQDLEALQRILQA